MRQTFTTLILLFFACIQGYSQCEAYFTYTINENGVAIFTNASTPDEDNLDILWEFGDGSIGVGDIVTHEFAVSGTYQVCLYLGVYDGNDLVCSDDYCGQVDVEFTSSACPTSFTITETDCNEFEFELDNFVDGSSIYWWFGDGTAQTSFSSFVSHTYENPGVYTVIASDNGECVFYQTEIVEATCVEDEDCPSSFSITPINCSTYHFVIDGVNDGDVLWDFGYADYEVEGGIELNHSFCTPYSDYWTILSATYTSDACPAGVTISTTFQFENPCDPPSVSYEEGEECGEVLFQLNASPGQDYNVFWYFDFYNNFSDPEMGGMEISHTYEEPGTYGVYAHFENENCPMSETMTYDIEIEACNEEDCPTEIFSGAGEECGNMHFEIGSLVEGEEVTWYPGDETGPVEGGHFFSHTYAEPGEYNVCAFYTTPACPDGVELCTTIVVEECAEEGCPDYIIGDQIDCDSYVFHIAGANTGNVIWNFGDGVNETSSVDADHTYAENGVYVVTAQFSGPGCGNGVMLYYTVNVECEGGGEENCPEQISSNAGDGCGVMNFEIGSFVQGEEVTWFPGDETGIVQGGHFFSHTYAEPGVYNVCAFYSSPACPDGVQLCTTVTVADCNEECSEVTFIITSFVALNGPASGVLGVYDIDAQEIAAFGNFTWSENVQTNVLNVCLPDGCYEVIVDGACCINYGTNYSVIAASNDADILFSSYTPNDNISGSFQLGVNNNCIDDCPTEIWSGAGEECGNMNFEIGSFVEGEDVTWYPGDETGAVEGGHFFSHTYAEPGEYNVCAFYMSPDCPNGVELCTTIVVEECYDCGIEIAATQNEDNNFTFIATGNPEVNPMHWTISNGFELEATWVLDYTFEEDGLYTVCGWVESEECGVVEDCITVYIGEEVCPTEVMVSDEINCHQFGFSVNNWDENSSIEWHFGDNTGGEMGSNPMHTFLDPDVYVVCAEGTTATCPSGFEICTEVAVEACGQNEEGCPSFVWGTPVDDCGLWHFEAGAPNENAIVTWYFDDGTSSDNFNTIAEHQFEEDGIYIITVEIQNYSEDCPESITIDYVVEVDVCEGDNCAQEIWSGEGEECGLWMFEAGSFVEGEEFIWYFGDGDVQEGGHYITHQYDEPGVYTVSCVFSNNLCEGYQLTTVVTVEDCGGGCTEVNIGLDSYVGEGGPVAAYWWVQNDDNVTVFNGVAQYSENDNYFDETVCLEDGCYTLFLEGLGVAGEYFDYFLSIDGESVIQNVEVMNDNLVHITFGVNSDCSGGDDCEASFEVIYTDTPGHIEFQNTSSYDGEAEWLWEYGNSTISDDFGGNVWYDENGQYQVCLTVTTENCTDTYCEDVFVIGMGTGCDENTVLITVSAEFDEQEFNYIDIILSNSDFSLENIGVIAINGSLTFEGCVPDGCYDVILELSDNSELTADFINVVVTYGNEIADMTLEEGVEFISEQLSVNVDCGDNVSEMDASLFSLYPNPANDMIRVVSSSNDKVSRIDVLDATGRMILSENNTTQVNVSGLASGSYFVRIASADNLITLPLIIQH